MTETIHYDEAGFRIRSEQPTRVEGFVDAAFAFAVTLLVVAVGNVPSSVADLMRALNGVPAFAASFLLIAVFWQTHRRWSRRYAIEDTQSVRLSLALVFVTLIYVYPLRIVSEMAIGGPRTVQIHHVVELRELYAIYAVGYAIIEIIFVLLFRHALACADAIGLSPMERLRTRCSIARNGLFLVVAAFSLLLALTLPMGNTHPVLNAMPGIVYFMILPMAFAVRQRERTALATLPGTAS